MNERRTPWVVLVFAVLTLSQAPRLIPLAGDRPEPQPAAQSSAQATEDAEPPGWKEPLRLYQEFFGLEVIGEEKKTPPADEKIAVPLAVNDGSPRLTIEQPGTPPLASSPNAIAQIQQKVHASPGFHLEFMVVLVPDPLDSHLAYEFDQALDGVQMGFANAGYLLDRQTLPWFGEGARLHSYRTSPGLLLYRKEEVQPDGCPTKVRLASVFLVGESPKQGIHKQAFWAALQLISQFQEPGPDSAYSYRIVGPSLSGSVFSLKQALLDWQERFCVDPGPCPGDFHLITGSATAPKLTNQFNELKRLWDDLIIFQRTVVSDDLLWLKAQSRLEDLGWDLQRLALLSEADTAYGQQSFDNVPPQPIEVRFPSGLGGIRSAWEADERKAPEKPLVKIPLPRTALDLILSGPAQPVDLVPQASNLTVSSDDLMLSNLLSYLRREGVGYIGIRASDVRDRIFLAKHIRRSAPGTILLTYGNNLLYAHPKSGGHLQGTLVITSFPLALEDDLWKYTFLNPGTAVPYRRQFTSSFQQGAYLAVREHMLKSIADAAGKGKNWKPSRPTAWIAVVGGDNLWPLIHLSPDNGIDFPPQDHRNDLHLLALMIVLFLLAYWLSEMRRTPHSKGTAWPDEILTHRLVVLGAALLVLMSGMLALVAALPFWNRPPGNWGAALGDRELGSVLYLAGIALAFALTLWKVSEATYPNEYPSWLRRHTGRPIRVSRPAWMATGCLAGLGALPLIAVSLQYFWMIGGPELFDMRARRFSSGLSPIPPFLLLGFALFLWLLLEHSRGRLLELHTTRWPLPPRSGGSALAGSARLATRLSQFMYHSLMTIKADRRRARLQWVRSRRFWLILTIVLLPPCIRLLYVLQPICERRATGWIFLALLVACVIAGVFSFRQFFVSWLLLERLLRRLELSSFQEAFSRISTEIKWSPMRSFGWRVPALQIPILSMDTLRAVQQLRWTSIEDLLDQSEKLLQLIFKADTEGCITAEHRSRMAFNQLLLDVSRRLAAQPGTPEIEDFLAVRLVAYLRPVFAHMRQCLLQAMACFLLALSAASVYAFQPQWFVQLALWTSIVAGVVLALWIFFQMDRNAVLSAIAHTTAGKVTFDSNLVRNLFTYAVVPVVAALAVYFPPFGRLLTNLFGSVTRLAGG